MTSQNLRRGPGLRKPGGGGGGNAKFLHGWCDRGITVLIEEGGGGGGGGYWAPLSSLPLSSFFAEVFSSFKLFSTTARLPLGLPAPMLPCGTNLPARSSTFELPLSGASLAQWAKPQYQLLTQKTKTANP